MRTRLPIFALLVLLAAGAGWVVAQSRHTAKDAPQDSAAPAGAAFQTPAVPPAKSPGEVVVPDIDVLLRQAVAQLSATGSIEAKIRQRIDLFDRELIGSGSYAQQGAGVTTQMRLEMRMRAESAATELLQVCNGETLWTFNAADGQRTLRRVDVDRVLDALRGDSRGLRATTSIAAPSIGLGGMPWMLEGLRQNCRFEEVRSERLGDVDVHAVYGTWRTEKVLSLLPEHEQKRIAAGGKLDVARLPPHLSDRVVIYLGRDDLFPYRFDYGRTQPLTEKQSAAGETPTTKTIMTLEFYEVRFGRPIPRERFYYKPGQGAIDDTERYIARLKAEK